MTLISAFSIDSCPIVFGDLLVTGPTSGSKSVAVPALGEVQDYFGESGWAVKGLYQKLSVISHNCVIAWAGSFVGAKNAISELKAIADKTELNLEIIFQYLRNDSDLRNHPASFVGIVREKSGTKQFKFNANEFDSKSLGLVYFAGTGSKAMFEFSTVLGSAGIKGTGEPGNVGKAFASALSLGGMLLQSELRGKGASTILNMFGGGYEIASFHSGRIQKLGEITYVLWSASLLSDDSIGLSEPQLVIKQKYLGDYLFIRSVRIRSEGNEKVKEDHRHIISPMFPSTPVFEVSIVENFPLESHLMCHCIHLNNGDDFAGLYTLVQMTDHTEGFAMTFRDEENRMTVGFKNGLLQRIVQSLNEFRKV